MEATHYAVGPNSSREGPWRNYVRNGPLPFWASINVKSAQFVLALLGQTVDTVNVVAPLVLEGALVREDVAQWDCSLWMAPTVRAFPPWRV